MSLADNNSDMVDKRVFSRYKVNFECHFVVEGDLRVFEARILDLSLTGLRLLIPYPVSLQPGQEVQFSFTSKPPVKGKARVVWVKQTKSGLMAGLEIVQLPPRFLKALQKVVNELSLLHLSDAYLR